MALQKTIISSTGLEIENAYIKIINYTCDNDNVVQATLVAFVSHQFSIEGKSPIEGSKNTITLVDTDYSDNAINAKKQIYDYAKTLDDYKGATDC